MTTLFKVLTLSLAVSFALGSFAHAGRGRSTQARGGLTDGGSTATLNQAGQTVHLDLWLNNPNFVDTAPRGISELRNLKAGGIIIDVSTNALIGKLIDQPHYYEILQRISLWEASSPVMALYLKRMLARLEFYLISDFESHSTFKIGPYQYESRGLKTIRFTNGDREEIERNYGLSLGNSTPSHIIPVARYNIPGLSAFSLNQSTFEKLGSYSQQAVFLKETIRSMQIAIGSIYGKLFPDATAQYLVAKILTQSPAPGETLDDGRLFPDVDVLIGSTAWASRMNVASMVTLDLPSIRSNISAICAGLTRFRENYDLKKLHSSHCAPGNQDSMISPTVLSNLSTALGQSFMSVANGTNQRNIEIYFSLVRKAQETANLLDKIPVSFSRWM